jgi:glycosyltransferase involved in cell wall biosynthesis
MKTAIIHDWLTSMGGAEKVLKAIHDLYPSKIYTLIKDSSKLKHTLFFDKEIESSFIQSLPMANKWYRNYLPLFPIAIEQFNLSDYDLILSSSHAVAKGVLTHTSQLHICYCHTPMRYAWDLYSLYMEPLKGIKKIMAQLALHGIRKWDIASAHRVDHFIANSYYVAQRIEKIYRRPAHVIYPPVDIDSFYIADQKEEYFIACSRMVPYKKMDMIARAFQSMPDKKLILVGDGPQMSAIKKWASPNIEILGFVSDETLKTLLSKAKAMVFAADEDFGIVMIEALASGTPVIALGKGAACEIINHQKTGILYREQTVDSLIEAVKAFEEIQHRFDPIDLKEYSKRFSKQRFNREFNFFVSEKYDAFINRSKSVQATLTPLYNK